jgi:hypothetical protein
MNDSKENYTPFARTRVPDALEALFCSNRVAGLTLQARVTREAVNAPAQEASYS